MASSKYYHSLQQWVLKNGGSIHPHVEIVDSEDYGHQVRVRPDVSGGLKASSCVLKCPISLTISCLNAIDTAPFESHGTKFPISFLRRAEAHTVTCFFLMQQALLGDQSFWAPYIRTLGRPGDGKPLSLLQWNHEDLQWLQGTNLMPAKNELEMKWSKSYESGLELLRAQEWPGLPKYSWELFLWAASVLSSRAFTPEILRSTLPADKASSLGKELPDHEQLTALFREGFPVLVPLVDIANYRPMAQVEWQAGMHDIGLVISEPVEAGQQVFNNYGPKGNEQLLLGYGFAIPENPCDFVSVAFKVPPGSPLAQYRAQEIKLRAAIGLPPRDNKDRHYEIYRPDNPFPQADPDIKDTLEDSLFSRDLWYAISILSANTRELNNVRFDNTSTWIKLGDHPWCGRNHLNTIAQLLAECKGRLGKLQTAANPTSEPESPQQHHAKVFRQGQTRILQAAVVILSSSLAKAMTDAETWTTPDKNKDIRDLCTDDNLYRLIADAVQKCPDRLVEHTGELLSLDSFLQLLPSARRSSVTGILSTLTTHNSQQPASPPIKLIILLVFLRSVTEATSKNGTADTTSNSNRITSWIHSMSEIYPADPIVDDIAELLEYDPQLASYEDALRSIVRTNPGMHLTWAAQVVDEEGVNIPTEAGASEYFLYVPQLDA